MTTTDQARAMVMALPGVEEKNHFDVVDFRVRNRIFATLPEDGRMVLRLDPADQPALMASNPETFSAEGYWGRQGWTAVQLDSVDPDELRELATDAWRRRAPKKLMVAEEGGAGG